MTEFRCNFSNTYGTDESVDTPPTTPHGKRRRRSSPPLQQPPQRKKSRFSSPFTLYPQPLAEYYEDSSDGTALTDNVEATQYNVRDDDDRQQFLEKLQYLKQALRNSPAHLKSYCKAEIAAFIRAQQSLRRSPRLSQKEQLKTTPSAEASIRIGFHHRQEGSSEIRKQLSQETKQKIAEQSREPRETTKTKQKELQNFIDTFEKKGCCTKDALLYETDKHNRCTRVMALVLPNSDLPTSVLRNSARNNIHNPDPRRYDLGHMVGLETCPFSNNIKVSVQHFLGNQAVMRTIERQAIKYKNTHPDQYCILEVYALYPTHKAAGRLATIPTRYTASLYAADKKTYRTVGFDTIFTIGFNNPQNPTDGYDMQTTTSTSSSFYQKNTPTDVHHSNEDLGKPPCNVSF